MQPFCLGGKKEMDATPGKTSGGGGIGPNYTIFDSLSFDPQLFINDVRNAVDDIVDEGFIFFNDQTPKILGVNDGNTTKELSEGVDAVKYMVHKKLDKQLDIWENYCLLNCFAIPEGLAFPEMNDVEGSLFESTFSDKFSEKDLDTQLESLREKLIMVGRESAELHRELCTLERQAVISTQCAEALNEALCPLVERSTHDAIQAEIVRTSLELQKKMEQLKAERRDRMENLRLERIRTPDLIHAKQKFTQTSIEGFQARVEDLLQFAENFKGII